MIGPCVDADPNVFFPEELNTRAFDPARAVCATCPLATWWTCLLDAIDDGEEFGVFGGQSPKDRRAFQKKGYVHARKVARKRPAREAAEELAGTVQGDPQALPVAV